MTHGGHVNVDMLRPLAQASRDSSVSTGGLGTFTGGAPGVQRRIMAALGAAFVALVALFALAQPASADGETIGGRRIQKFTKVTCPGNSQGKGNGAPDGCPHRPAGMRAAMRLSKAGSAWRVGALPSVRK